MRFGAALELWHKGDLHLTSEDDPDPQVGLTDQQFDGFTAGIAAAPGTRELADIWKQIAKACNDAKDQTSYQSLKHQVAHRGAALKAQEANNE